MTAIKKNLGNFAAIIGLVLIAAGVSVYILGQQRMRFPFVQPKPYQLKAEFSTAQAVVAGQGQTVRVSGVRIGDIGGVELKNGHAVIKMDIDPEYKENIFGLFKRLHTSDEYSGTGIGLALCKKIMENHGGYITATSKRGKGATFYAYFPQTVLSISD